MGLFSRKKSTKSKKNVGEEKTAKKTEKGTQTADDKHQYNIRLLHSWQTATIVRQWKIKHMEKMSVMELRRQRNMSAAISS